MIDPAVQWHLRVEPTVEAHEHWMYSGPQSQPGFLASAPPADLDSTRTYATWVNADNVEVSYYDGPGGFDPPGVANVFGGGPVGAPHCGFTPEVDDIRLPGFRWHAERHLPNRLEAVNGFVGVEWDGTLDEFWAQAGAATPSKAFSDGHAAAEAAARDHVAQAVAADATAQAAAGVKTIELDSAGVETAPDMSDPDPLEVLLHQVAAGVDTWPQDDVDAVEQQICLYSAPLLEGDATDAHLVVLTAITAALAVVRGERARRAAVAERVAELRDEILHPTPKTEAADDDAGDLARHARTVAGEFTGLP